jgi:hypothetical protein
MATKKKSIVMDELKDKDFMEIMANGSKSSPSRIA